MSDDLEYVEKHWYDGEKGKLIDRIEQALKQDGKDPSNLSIDDLAAVDEHHIRGREATVEVTELADIQANEHVLDVGSGIGGPARYLATTRGCEVTGIDLTAEYCDVANYLAEKVGLADRVRHQQANALDLPFEDESFDVAWTQHISMNIPDKHAFFAEMCRVVKPGGKVVVYDPIKGDQHPLTFPVPWSRDGLISFLVNSSETRETLEDLDLDITEWHDVSQKSISWFAANARQPANPKALGINLLLGDEWPQMAANMVKNLNEGRISIIQVVALKR
jgi:ubiquinone/menaquinone biosynthesis C-methylase UbiE